PFTLSVPSPLLLTSPHPSTSLLPSLPPDSLEAASVDHGLAVLERLEDADRATRRVQTDEGRLRSMQFDGAPAGAPSNCMERRRPSSVWTRRVARSASSRRSRTARPWSTEAASKESGGREGRSDVEGWGEVRRRGDGTESVK